LDALSQGAALLVAEEKCRPAVPTPQPAHERGVVAGQAVAMQLDEVRREALDVVEGVRTIGMPGELDGFPDAHGLTCISRRWASNGRSSVRDVTRSTCPCAI